MSNGLVAGFAAASFVALGIVAAPELCAQPSASGKTTVARTADGHPDLSGMYKEEAAAPSTRR